jgi:hypothetical protein
VVEVRHVLLLLEPLLHYPLEAVEELPDAKEEFLHVVVVEV